MRKNNLILVLVIIALFIGIMRPWELIISGFNKNNITHSDEPINTISGEFGRTIQCAQCHGEGVCRHCGGEGFREGRRCSRCDGSGRCPNCDGMGNLEVFVIDGKDYTRCTSCKGSKVCSLCQGTGIYSQLGFKGPCMLCNGQKKCLRCHGKGYLLLRGF